MDKRGVEAFKAVSAIGNNRKRYPSGELSKPKCLPSHHPSLGIARRGVSLIVFTLLLIAAQPVEAQNIPSNGNLDTAATANGGTWILAGNAYTLVGGGKNLPVTFTITGAAGGTTITNTATLASYGIFRNTGSAMTLTLSDLTLTGGNTAGSGAGYGGAIVSGPGLTMTTSNVVFFNNQSGTRGGAIHVTKGGLSITGDATFLGNSSGAGGGSAQAGGAVNVGDGLFTITGAVIARNNVIANGSGGAFYSSGAASLAATSGDVELTQNIAQNSGGGIYAARGAQIGNASSLVAITGNKAGFDSAGTQLNAAANGGGIHAGTATTAGVVEITGTSITLSDNTASLSGGGIYAMQTTSDNSLLTVSILGDLTSKHNAALKGAGGAINVQGGSVKVSGSLDASDNTAATDGGAIEASLGSVTVTGGIDLDANQALGGSGGAIHAAMGSVKLATDTGDVSLTGNEASGTAGKGGAIYAGAGGVSIGNSGGTVSIGTDSGGNTAKTDGGAIFTAGQTILTGTQISVTDNVAGGNGGGIFSAKAVAANGALTLDGNTALAGSGGGISAQTGGVTIHGTLLATDNTASASGGAIQTAAGDISVSGATRASGNSATAGFGGALNAANGNVHLATSEGDVSLTGNQAGLSGGAIGQGGSGEATVGNAAGTTTITGNDAAMDGGAIYSSASTTVTGAIVTLQDNTAAAGSGGAVYAGADFTLVAAGPTTVSGNSAGALGGAIWAGNSVNLAATSGDIVFTGNEQASGANAIYLGNSTGAGVATFEAAAGRIITFFDPIASDPDNGSVSVVKTGAGMVSFDGSKHTNSSDQWSQVFADTRVLAGMFEVTNNAVYGALSTDAAGPAGATSFTSEAGTTVQGGAMGTIRADAVTLNGALDIAGRQPDARGVFAISTNALTLGGGNIRFNTYLDDGSSQNTDLLVLDLHGSATNGQSFIMVNPIGGAGLKTTGDGIKLVETNGTGTTAGAFALGNRVAAGAYEYLLFHGGDPANGGDANDQNWYLRNVFTPAPTLNEPAPQTVPIIRPEVPISMAVLPLALEYGNAMLDTLHERVGATYLHKAGPATEERVVWCKDASQNFHCVVRVPVATANGAGKDETRWVSSGWARLIGNRGLHQPDNFLRRGPNYDYVFGGIQAGLDLWAHPQVDGTLDKAGIYIGYGQISSNVKGQFGSKAGSIDMDAYTLAGYWTHFSPQGWYTDAVVQGTWYAADAKSALGQRIKPDGFSILASLEGGYVVTLGAGWTLEPQAQFIYQNASFDNARDAYGMLRFDDSDSLRGRLGIRVANTWNTAETARAPRLITAWLRANVWHEFMGKGTTSWGTLNGGHMIPFNTYLDGTWGEFGAGVTTQVSDEINLFASGTYNRSLDGKGRQGWDGRLGMNLKW